MDLNIDGRIALVLGAGGGLGRAAAVSLAREGVSVALADINESSLAMTEAAIKEAGGRSRCFVFDLGQADAYDTQVKTIEDWTGKNIDILVNITGGPPPTPVAEQDLRLWSDQFRNMVLSVIGITDRILPGMRANGWGRIITSTSSGVVVPIPNLGISNSLRLSLVGWSKTLSQEVARFGITSNIVVPGRIATARVHQLDNAKGEREGRSVNSVVAESVAKIPLGRYGKPEEYADVMTFLASERASYITGAMICVDGGYIQCI